MTISRDSFLCSIGFYSCREIRAGKLSRALNWPLATTCSISCGTGRSLGYLHQAVGPAGRVYGVDISRGMLRQAQKSCDSYHWRNVELTECDAAEYTAPRPLNGVLFSLSYNTMPHHRAVLRRRGISSFPAEPLSSWMRRCLLD
jgi:trans-aconitate methyltransferase